MASSLGSPPSKRELLKVTVCGVAIFGGLGLALASGWIGLMIMLGPSLWKTVIGDVKTHGGNTLAIGRAHDGDISYNYYVRVRGAGGDLDEWTYVGYSLDPTRSSVTALTSDSRYAAIAFDTDNGKAMVIYDSDVKELWWNADNQWKSTSRFVRAWRLLYSENPHLPPPLY